MKKPPTIVILDTRLHGPDWAADWLNLNADVMALYRGLVITIPGRAAPLPAKAKSRRRRAA